MKKLVALMIAVAFFAGFSLIGCGPSAEPPKPAPPKEEAKPAAPAPAPEKPAPAPEKPAEAKPAAVIGRAGTLGRTTRREDF